MLKVNIKASTCIEPGKTKLELGLLWIKKNIQYFPNGHSIRYFNKITCELKMFLFYF